MPALRCEACGARVTNLRRGRCSICYLRWADSRPVGLGASCILCGERRHDNLKQVEFQSTWLPMCHNCAARAFKLNPLPSSLTALRQRLKRDQRGGDRRDGMPDPRIVAKERRAESERRAFPHMFTAEDWVDAEDLIIEIMELQEAYAGSGEQTQIVKLAELADEGETGLDAAEADQNRA